MPETDPYIRETVEAQQKGVTEQNAIREAANKSIASLVGQRKPADHFFPEPGKEELDLSWLNLKNVEDLTDVEPQRIIEGLLRVGEKLGLTAGSKKFKSWILLHLAYCIANGLPFIGFDTVECKVAIYDLELSAWGLRKRLERIRKAIGKGDFRNLKICSLKGKAKKFCANFETAQKQLKAEGIKVIIIDPAYKFLLGKNESDNGMVADVLDNLTVFCMEAGVALIYVHHHSKGNQAGKDSLDRGSGAGAWSRDPDAVLDLTEHKDSTKTERIYKCEITVREFPPIENFVVRWGHPLLEKDTEGLDPEEIKGPTKGTAGRPKSDAREKIDVALRTAEIYGQLPALKVSQIETVTGLPRRSVYDAISKMNGRVVKSAILKSGFQLSPTERAKFPISEDRNEENPCTD